ncbi:AarF/ABC1/UbiB kinase family protein [Smaragdicoccus niigatensis]
MIEAVSEHVPTSRLARGTKLGAAAAGQVLIRSKARLSMLGRSAEVRERLSEESTMRAAEQIVTVLGGMKGVAMKLGQMMSILDMDLVPADHRESFQRKLAVLRDSAPTVPFDRMVRVIERDLRMPIEQAFATFDETAIGSASIGQVYRATLPDGTDVAVKVQYPGIDRAVRADLQNLVMLRRFVQSVFPLIGPGVIDELAANMELELDYHREAQTQRRVADTFRNHPFITVPDSFPELSGRRVLVTEFVEGMNFEQICELDQDERNRVGEIMYRFYIGSLYQFNEFCGDPHPGNVLLAKDGRVAFLDFGLFNAMSEEHVEFELECLRAASEGRADDLYALLDKRGFLDKDVEVSAEECLDYVLAASEWNLIDAELEVTPDVAGGAFLLAIDPRASEFQGMKHQNLPPEHLFSRRADFFTFGILGQLGVSANWHRIAREWIYGEPPATKLGEQHQQWLKSLEGQQ